MPNRSRSIWTSQRRWSRRHVATITTDASRRLLRLPPPHVHSARSTRPGGDRRRAFGRSRSLPCLAPGRRCPRRKVQRVRDTKVVPVGLSQGTSRTFPAQDSYFPRASVGLSQTTDMRVWLKKPDDRTSGILCSVAYALEMSRSDAPKGHNGKTGLPLRGSRRVLSWKILARLPSKQAIWCALIGILTK